MKKIILIGYMASGKTTIAKLLSEELKLEHFDLDDLIESETNLTLDAIFREKGEIYFRKLEHFYFKEYIENDVSFVMSTGGGTPCYANNHLLLKNERSHSIYLKASIDTICTQITQDHKIRPLVSHFSEADLRTFVATHLFERSYFYNHADFTVTVDNKTPESIVSEIISLLS